MRGIKFRGKRIDTGEWAYGSLSIEFDNTHRISLWVNTLIEPENNYWESVNEIYEVIAESIGQFTGLKDRSGTEIYEGDIIKFHYFYQSLGENLGVQEAEHELTGRVVWGEFGWAVDTIKGQHWEGYTGYQTGEGECSILELYAMNEFSIHEESFEVIDNIHDELNPAKGAVINTMTTDPKEGQEEVKAPATETEQEQAPGEVLENQDESGEE